MDNSLLIFAACATSDDELAGVLHHVDLGATDHHYQGRLDQITARISGEKAGVYWKKGRCSAKTGESIATLCGDPDLLLAMAKKETRQGVLWSLAQNAALPVEGLLLLPAKLSYHHNLASTITRRITAEPLTPTLTQMMHETTNDTARSAYALHPEHTEETLLPLLTDEASPRWAHAIATREDLGTMEEVLGRLSALLATTGHTQTTRNLLVREDLGTLPLFMWEALTGTGHHNDLLSHPGLPTSILERIVREVQEPLGEVANNWERQGRISYRLQSWQLLGTHKEIPRETLLQAPLFPQTYPLLARFLREDHPGSQSAWELAAGLLDSGQGQSVGDFLQAVGALLG